MASSPNKIVLKSTTKMSLNDRFAVIRKSAESTVNAISQKMRQSRQASSKNLRLVQQMENRPSVIAALKLKKKSMKQRLGPGSPSGVKSRLSVGARRGARGGAVIPNRPPRGGSQQNGRGGQRFRINRPGQQFDSGGGRSRGRGAQRGSRRGISPLARTRSNNNKFTFGGNSQNKFIRGNKPRIQVNIGREGNFRNRPFNQGDQIRGGRGGRINRGGRGGRFQGGRGGGRRPQTSQRGRGGAQTGWGNAALPSKHQLDTELDEYMSKSRGSLDNELERYMAQANE